jgi:hypothetical protein
LRKTSIAICVTIIIALGSTAQAGRLTSTMITHLEQIHQACTATSDDCVTFRGYLRPEANVISAAPGILAIDPGGAAWPNFVGAAQANPPVPYTIKNVSLVKECPQYVQCGDVFVPRTISQQGTSNIRLWWPLMYELPSCVFKLTILYGTPVLYDDDGSGPNPPAWVHVEQWVWHVDVDIPRLSTLLELFHELPFGLDEVPLISDEPLYEALQTKLADAQAAFLAGNTAQAALILTDFELEVMDACIDVSPPFPNPTGPGTGIANTEENPACCKLLVDVEYILQTSGIGQPGK